MDLTGRAKINGMRPSFLGWSILLVCLQHMITTTRLENLAAYHRA